MAQIEINGTTFTVPEPVAELMLSISEERDNLRSLVRDVIAIRVEHLNELAYHNAMDKICVRANRALAMTSDA